MSFVMTINYFYRETPSRLQRGKYLPKPLYCSAKCFFDKLCIAAASTYYKAIEDNTNFLRE